LALRASRNPDASLNPGKIFPLSKGCGEARNANHFTLPAIGDWFQPREWQFCAAFAGAPEVLDRYTRDLTRLPVNPAQPLP
jgi:hypothetical protein